MEKHKEIKVGRPKNAINIPRFCKKCGVSLDLDINWAEGSVRKGFYICNGCKNEKYKRYRHNNPFKAKLSYFNKRHKACLTVDDLEKLWEKQSGKCGVCQSLIDINYKHCIDHIVPSSKGGTSELSNLQFTCYKCNTGKHNFSLKEYIEHCIKVANCYKNENLP